ncbi:hypothetical protein KY339_01190 [Candidatus Woesearchaeota archaeon]|nr:hypothetical protein [Candidatus Woesearchaeota archaeon]
MPEEKPERPTVILFYEDKKENEPSYMAFVVADISTHYHVEDVLKVLAPQIGISYKKSGKGTDLANRVEKNIFRGGKEFYGSIIELEDPVLFGESKLKSVNFNILMARMSTIPHRDSPEECIEYLRQISMEHLDSSYTSTNIEERVDSMFKSRPKPISVSGESISDAMSAVAEATKPKEKDYDILDEPEEEPEEKKPEIPKERQGFYIFVENLRKEDKEDFDDEDIIFGDHD